MLPWSYLLFGRSGVRILNPQATLGFQGLGTFPVLTFNSTDF